MSMKSVWSLSEKELLDLGQSKPWPCPKKDIGDITVVCHVSNSASLLKEMLVTASSITDKFIILDDCSKDDTVKVAADYGCKVYGIPEGWIYTHGFGELIKRQQKLCTTQYHFQLDAGEYLYLNPDNNQKLSGDYYWTLRVHFQNPSQKDFRQPMLNRLFKTSVPLTFPAVIHGSPVEPQKKPHALPRTELIIFHGTPKFQNNSQYFTARKLRLYYKLMKKGYENRTLENNFWYKWYEDHREFLNSEIVRLEKEIGTLEETKEDIYLIK